MIYLIFYLIIKLKSLRQKDIIAEQFDIAVESFDTFLNYKKQAKTEKNIRSSLKRQEVAEKEI